MAFNGHNVRHVVIDGNPWFVARDICDCLSLQTRNCSAASYLKNIRAGERCLIRRRHAEEDLRGTDPYSVQHLFPRGCNAPSLTLISESGLYKLIMRSDKPVVAKFQDWVTQEVLPSIRKTGSYSLGTTQPQMALPAPEVASQALEASAINAGFHRLRKLRDAPWHLA